METATHALPQISAKLDAARAALFDLGAERSALTSAIEAAETVVALTQDTDLAVASALHWMRLSGLAREPAPADTRLSPAALRLAGDLARLGRLSLPADWSATQGLNAQQAEPVRKMLLAVAADPRLVVARLADQVVRLRHARELAPLEQQRLALETREILAPLANRLGVWNLKWELEDLAFRYLEPERYHGIALALAERRVDRERYIESVRALLERELTSAGLAAQVYGRPKHIYSIARKMQRKHLGFEQLFDVRAVRIVVDSIADCYAALGVVHSLWHYVPGEFDDYIATPKGNEYRSIHTAVIGPEGKSLEVQIRTRDMHEQAELGIAAHWRYKEGSGRDAGYERKIEWVRRVLDPTAAIELDGDPIERLKGELFADRIYAMTPRGEVVDLPRGSTPLDFAYHVHSDLGHRCRGAKINGRIHTLDRRFRPRRSRRSLNQVRSRSRAGRGAPGAQRTVQHRAHAAATRQGAFAGRDRGRRGFADHHGALLQPGATGRYCRLCHTRPRRHDSSGALCQSAAHACAQARTRAERGMDPARRQPDAGANTRRSVRPPRSAA